MPLSPAVTGPSLLKFCSGPRPEQHWRENWATVLPPLPPSACSARTAFPTSCGNALATSTAHCGESTACPAPSTWSGQPAERRMKRVPRPPASAGAARRAGGGECVGSETARDVAFSASHGSWAARPPQGRR